MVLKGVVIELFWAKEHANEIVIDFDQFVKLRFCFYLAKEGKKIIF